MSASLSPAGLDSLDSDDQALLDAMRSDSGPEDNAPAPEATDDTGATTEIDLPPEAEATPDKSGRQKTMVPHAALHREREKAKEAETARLAAEEKATVAQSALAAERLEAAKVSERIRILTELATMPVPAAPVAAPAPEPDPPPLPDVATDPIGHFTEAFKRSEAARLHDATEAAKRHETLEGRLREVQQGADQHRQAQGLQAWGQQQEMAFEAAEPSYRAAMDYLRTSRHAELEAIGVTDPALREQAIRNDVRAIAVQAQREGVNFAERLYKGAVARGFAKAAPAPAPAPAAPVVDTAAATRAARIQDGMDNATTLSSAGAAPAAKMSVERILSLPDAEFEALTARMKANGTFRELMGM